MFVHSSWYCLEIYKGSAFQQVTQVVLFCWQLNPGDGLACDSVYHGIFLFVTRLTTVCVPCRVKLSWQYTWCLSYVLGYALMKMFCCVICGKIRCSICPQHFHCWAPNPLWPAVVICECVSSQSIWLVKYCCLRKLGLVTVIWVRPLSLVDTKVWIEMLHQPDNCGPMWWKIFCFPGIWVNWNHLLPLSGLSY